MPTNKLTDDEAAACFDFLAFTLASFEKANGLTFASLTKSAFLAGALALAVSLDHDSLGRILRGAGATLAVEPGGITIATRPTITTPRGPRL